MLQRLKALLTSLTIFIAKVLLISTLSFCIISIVILAPQGSLYVLHITYYVYYILRITYYVLNSRPSDYDSVDDQRLKLNNLRVADAFYTFTFLELNER